MNYRGIIFGVLVLLVSSCAQSSEEPSLLAQDASLLAMHRLAISAFGVSASVQDDLLKSSLMKSTYLAAVDCKLKHENDYPKIVCADTKCAWILNCVDFGVHIEFAAFRAMLTFPKNFEVFNSTFAEFLTLLTAEKSAEIAAFMIKTLNGSEIFTYLCPRCKGTLWTI